jgi:hypothetical protein
MFGFQIDQIEKNFLGANSAPAGGDVRRPTADPHLTFEIMQR